ncbi:MAG: endopeptidase La [Planctomycetota bacterium]|nr:endopeptidase La [Planctomycetota bacterium]
MTVVPAAHPPTTLAFPLLPLRDGVLFPQLMMPHVVQRPQAIAAVMAALATEDKILAVVAQRRSDVEDPTLDQLYDVGVLAVIKKMGRVDDSLQVVLQGTTRVRLSTAATTANHAGTDKIATHENAPLLGVDNTSDYLKCQTELLPPPDDWTPDTEALHREVLDLAQQVVQRVNPESEPAFRQMLGQLKQPLQQIYLVSTLLSLSTEQEQGLLASNTLADALHKMHDYLSREIQVLKIRHQISSQVQSELSAEQREFLLRKQLQAIQEELGEQTAEQAELVDLKSRLLESGLPAAPRQLLERELSRLERLPASSPEFQITRSYLELVAELPWTKRSPALIDLSAARQVLDEDHYDLEKIKERIIEHLAVRKLNPTGKSPVLCFVGPPGVGKTSLGKSIARAVGREFSRISLGGLHDESELRGHRRTYVGAMPGRIIQAIRQAQVGNPLLMLDEVDKLGHDYRGDPAAALLEILDPAQNHDFRDNYLNLPFDLSQVFFIATANSLDPIPGPLLDRLEIIRLAGYTDEDKLHIACTYLLPRQLADSGLTPDQLRVDDSALMEIIQRYTREAGVRQLERALGRLCRRVATRVASGDVSPTSVDKQQLQSWLGGVEFTRDPARRNLPPGVAAGLAWTAAGGELLYVESVMLPEEGNLRITGQLGDVMKESASAAQSYVSSRWAEFDLDKRALRSGVHVHVPAGATPKDGPSAGVTMAVALTSLYSSIPVRDDIAMTGEITLSGLVLPVGGIREKVLAAYRAGIRTVILPEQNEKDLDDLSPPVREAMRFVLAHTIEDVLVTAIPQLEPRIRTHA